MLIEIIKIALIVITLVTISCITLFYLTEKIDQNLKRKWRKRTWK